MAHGAAADQLEAGSRCLSLRLQFNKVYCVGTLVQPNARTEQTVLRPNVPVPAKVVAINENVAFIVAGGIDVHVLGTLQFHGGFKNTAVPVLLLVFLH